MHVVTHVAARRRAQPGLLSLKRSLATLRETPLFLRKGLGAPPEHTMQIVERDNQEQLE